MQPKSSPIKDTQTAPAAVSLALMCLRDDRCLMGVQGFRSVNHRERKTRAGRNPVAINSLIHYFHLPLTLHSQKPCD